MGDDELKILIEASLDEVKSIQNILADLKQLQNKVKTYRLKVLAGLDKAASSAQIKSDLAQITKTKSKVKIVGEVDKSATRKNVDAAIKNLKNAEVKLTGVLDSSATQKNVQQQLGQIPKVETTANVNVSGGDEIEKLRSQMDSAGTSAAGMAAQLYVARSALQLLRRTAVEAKEIIIDLDSAATDLALATGSNSEEAYRLLEQYNALGKRLGATTAQVAEGATEWLRQGKSAAETSALIEQSMVLSKVGAMSADEATKNLTSTMKGFKLEVEDVAGVVDRLTALDLKAAVTSADLATAVARTASSANLAGVGLDKLLGYITVVEETTQKSAETIGESFKIIFARMGNVKLGKFLDDDGEDLSDTEKILSNFGIALRENNNQFREFDDVLDEVASRWSEFTNVEQSAIATTIAGTRQRENFLVLMENYGKALEYTGVAADSAGTALEKFEAYGSSIEAKSASFVAAMESLTMDTIDSNLVKDLIGGATAVIEFAEAAGLLKATLLALGTGATLKGIQLIATGFKNITQHVMNMGEASTILRKIGDVSALSGQQIKRLGTLTKGLSDDQLKLILSSRDLSTAQMQAILQASGLTKAEATQKIQTLGLATAQQTTTGATWSLTSALNGLKVAIMSNPIGSLMAAIAAATVVFSLVSNAIEDAKQKEEEARQKMLEVADAAKEEADAISDLHDVYTEANKAYQDGVGSKDDLTSATDSLLEALGYEKGAVADLVEEYGSLEKAIDGVTKKALEQKAASILEGYDAAKQAALSAAEDSMGWFSGSAITIKTSGDDKKFAELLQKAGYLGDGDLPLLSTSLYTGINNYGDIDSLVEGYEKLLAIKELLESGIGNGYSAEELSGAGVYTDVVAKINAVSDEIEAYKGVIKARNEVQAQLAYMDFVEANGVPETREEYEALKQSLLDTAEASGQYIGSLNDIEAAINSMLTTRPALQKFFATSAESAESISLYKAQLSDLTDVISGVKSSYEALEAAESDMASGGSLSTDTIEKLAKENENYLDYLYEENGVIKLNTEAWKENADAKMQGEIAEIQKEIDSLNERNRVLLESIAYYEQMRDTDSTPDMWDQEIAKTLDELKKNSEAVAENQKLYDKYTAIFELMRSDSDETFSGLTDHLTFITGQYDILTKAQEEFAESGILSASTLSSIVDKFPEMEDSVSLYIAGLKTSQELLDDLSAAYGADFENYRKAVLAKLSTSEEFYNSLTGDQKQLIDELGKSYGIDLQNFKTIEQKKLAFQAEIIKQLAANYSKYAGASLEELQSQYDDAVWSGNLDGAEMKALDNAISAIEKYNRTLNSIANGEGLINPYDPKKIKSSSASSAKEIEEYIAAIDQYRDALERLRQVQEDRSGIERQIDNSEDLKEQIAFQKQLIDVYQREQDALHNLNDQRDATIKSGVQSLRKLGFEVQYNADTNDLWIANMERLNELTAESKGEYGSVQEATNALRKDTEELIGTLEGLNEENRNGSDTWKDLEDSIREAKVSIVNDLKDIVSQASDMVDEIQNVYTTLKSAADEYAENGGFLTLDTYQAIIDLEPQYMQYLSDENNLLVINEENINKVIAAKTEQLALENAMSYVERLRLALQEDSIEDLNELLYATTAATNSTWGLVYANLALLDLDADQYQAALHNINSIRALADAAVDGIGRTAGEAANAAKEAAEAAKAELEDLRDSLEDMQDGCDDIVKYVMDMLKHRIQEQIDLLEEMKDKYSEIVSLKKESLRAAKDEEDYQKKISSKIKDMAKLQAKIDALGLAADQGDRKAAAERAKLLEEMAELQDELNDTQAEKAIEAAEDALDKMEDAYHQEKDAEIKILEDSISSQQKLYDMAVSYIRDHWNTLYSELIAWNTEYGSVLNSEISDAWESCQAAAQRYGDFVTALMGGIKNEIAAINAQIESISFSGGSYGTTGAGASGSNNTVVGEKKDYEDDYTSGYIAKISDLVEQMRENGRRWHTASGEEQRRLHADSVDKANQIARLGVAADYSLKTGEWIISSDRWNPSFVGRRLFDSYHTGGVVGQKPLKPDEQNITAKKGELILTRNQQDSLAAQIDQIRAMTEKFTNAPIFMSYPNLPDFSHLSNSTINNVTNTSNRPVEIRMGDTIVNCTAEKESAYIIADEVRNITRQNANDLAKRLGIRR